jgi:hypothetical protein
MRPLVPLLLFVSLLLPRLARPAELLPVAAPTTGPIRGISSAFSVAYGPDGGVAVWKVGFGALWGVPLDRDGRPAAPARWILEERDGIDQPEVRFMDGRFVLWWIRSWPRATRVADLDAELRPVGPRSIAVGTTAPLAWNGSVALATTGRYPFNALVSVHFLDRDFARLRSDSLADLGLVGYTAAVALADGTFGLVASGDRAVFLIRYSPQGERLGAPQQIALSGDVATDGESILIASAVPYAIGGPARYLRTLLIQRDGVGAESQTVLPEAVADLEVEWAGDSYTVVIAAGTIEGQTTDDVDLYASRISREGELLAPFTPIFVGPELEKRLALVRSDRMLLFFEEGGYGTGVLFAIALPAAGSLARPDLTIADARISDTAAIQGWASAASDGVGWMIVWKESTATRDEIRSVLLDRNGRPVTPPLTHASGGIFQLGSVNVTFDGIDYVVAWVDWGQLHVRRFRRDGSPVDPQPIVVAHEVSGGPKMASRDGVTLVAWSGVRGMLLYADGRTKALGRLTPEPHMDGDIYVSYDSEVVAAGGNGFLVAFAEERAFPCLFPGDCRSEYRAQAQLIARDGTPRGALMTFDSKGIASAAGAAGTFLVALDGGLAAVVDAAAATPLRTFGLTRHAAAVFETGGDYTAVSDEGDRLTVKRLRPDGTVIRTEETETDGRAATASSSGALLVVSGRSILDPPYYGVPAVVAGVADTFEPASSDRRRAVAR